MKHLDLFSGIGGFALATEMVWDNVEHVFCDNEPFAQAVLSKHWPNSIIHGDIKTLVPPPADIVTGGFPCQPFSAAGKRRGTEDDRHLWPEMLRVIRASAPRWVIGENVGGLVTWDGGLVLEGVLTDLENEGYEAWPFVIPAAGKNAPHRRNRIWIIAHSNGSHAGRIAGKLQSASKKERVQKRQSVGEPGCADSIRVSANAQGKRHGGRGSKECGTCKRVILSPKQKGSEAWSQDERRDWNAWPKIAAKLCTLDDGLPNGLARPKGWRNAALKGAGNAIVPQVAAQIMFAIKSIDPALV